MQEFVASVLGVEVALGSISKLERSMSAALRAPVEEARAYVREASSVNADETGWREKLRKAWLWVAATALVVVFAIHRERRFGDIGRSEVRRKSVLDFVDKRYVSLSQKLGAADKAKLGRVQKRVRGVSDIRTQETRWCGTLYPTLASAPGSSITWAGEKVTQPAAERESRLRSTTCRWPRSPGSTSSAP